MATLSVPLRPLPAASSGDTLYMVYTPSVAQLANWSWTTKKWRMDFTVSCDFGGGDVDGFSSTLYLEQGSQSSGGVSAATAYTNEKQILDYRVSYSRNEVSGSFANPARTWNASLDLGGDLLWTAVRDALGLITTGYYGFHCQPVLDITTPVGSFKIVRYSPIDVVAGQANGLTFDSLSHDLFYTTGGGIPLPCTVTSSITITRFANWTYT